MWYRIISKYKVKTCEGVEKEHRKSKRQYSHVLHRKNTICITPQLLNLPLIFLTGVLAHEIGHILQVEFNLKDLSEKGADRAFEKKFGIRIFRIDSTYGDDLQYLSPSDSKLFESDVLPVLIETYH